jgi:putative membrane protein
MQAFLIRLLINALGLWLAATIVPGIAIQGVGTLILAALVMGVVNALVRPVAFILTLPITIVTLGIFLLVLNAAMFALVAWVLPGFTVSGFWAALLGWLIVSIVSWFASSFVDRRQAEPR